MADLLSAYPPVLWVLLLGTGILIGLLAGLLGIGAVSRRKFRSTAQKSPEERQS